MRARAVMTDAPGLTPDTVEVPLSDGTALYLEASFNALCEFERVMVAEGFDPNLETERLMAGAGLLSSIRAMTWACARLRHPGLTLLQSGALLQRDGPALRAGLLRALGLSSPDPEDADSDAAPGKPTPPSA